MHAWWGFYYVLAFVLTLGFVWARYGRGLVSRGLHSLLCRFAKEPDLLSVKSSYKGITIDQLHLNTSTWKDGCLFFSFSVVKIRQLELSFVRASACVKLSIAGLEVCLKQKHMPQHLGTHHLEDHPNKAELQLLDSLLWKGLQGPTKVPLARATLRRILLSFINFVSHHIILELRDAVVQYKQEGDPGPRHAPPSGQLHSQALGATAAGRPQWGQSTAAVVSAQLQPHKPAVEMVELKLRILTVEAPTQLSAAAEDVVQGNFGGKVQETPEMEPESARVLPRRLFHVVKLFRWYKRYRKTRRIARMTTAADLLQCSAAGVDLVVYSNWAKQFEPPQAAGPAFTFGKPPPTGRPVRRSGAARSPSTSAPHGGLDPASFSAGSTNEWHLCESILKQWKAMLVLRLTTRPAGRHPSANQLDEEPPPSSPPALHLDISTGVGRAMARGAGAGGSDEDVRRAGQSAPLQRHVSLELVVEIKSVVPRLGPETAAALMRIAQRVVTYQRFARFWAVRPLVPVTRSPAQWWQHAGRAVLTEHRKLLQLQTLPAAMRRRRQYCNLYAALHGSRYTARGSLWRGQWHVGYKTRQVAQMLHVMENKMTISEVVHFRIAVAAKYSPALQGDPYLKHRLVGSVDALASLISILPSLVAAAMPPPPPLVSLSMKFSCPALGLHLVPAHAADSTTTSPPGTTGSGGAGTSATGGQQAAVVVLVEDIEVHLPAVGQMSIQAQQIRINSLPSAQQTACPPSPGPSHSIHEPHLLQIPMAPDRRAFHGPYMNFKPASTHVHNFAPHAPADPEMHMRVCPRSDICDLLTQIKVHLAATEVAFCFGVLSNTLEYAHSCIRHLKPPPPVPRKPPPGAGFPWAGQATAPAPPPPPPEPPMEAPELAPSLQALVLQSLGEAQIPVPHPWTSGQPPLDLICPHICVLAPFATPPPTPSALHPFPTSSHRPATHHALVLNLTDISFFAEYQGTSYHQLSKHDKIQFHLESAFIPLPLANQHASQYPHAAYPKIWLHPDDVSLLYPPQPPTFASLLAPTNSRRWSSSALRHRAMSLAAASPRFRPETPRGEQPLSLRGLRIPEGSLLSGQSSRSLLPLKPVPEETITHAFVPLLKAGPFYAATASLMPLEPTAPGAHTTQHSVAVPAILGWYSPIQAHLLGALITSLQSEISLLQPPQPSSPQPSPPPRPPTPSAPHTPAYPPCSHTGLLIQVDCISLLCFSKCTAIPTRTHIPNPHQTRFFVRPPAWTQQTTHLTIEPPRNPFLEYASLLSPVLSISVANTNLALSLQPGFPPALKVTSAGVLAANLQLSAPLPSSPRPRTPLAATRNPDFPNSRRNNSSPTRPQRSPSMPVTDNHPPHTPSSAATPSSPPSPKPNRPNSPSGHFYNIPLDPTLILKPLRPRAMPLLRLTHAYRRALLQTPSNALPPGPDRTTLLQLRWRRPLSLHLLQRRADLSLFLLSNPPIQQLAAQLQRTTSSPSTNPPAPPPNLRDPFTLYTHLYRLDLHRNPTQTPAHSPHQPHPTTSNAHPGAHSGTRSSTHSSTPSTTNLRGVLTSLTRTLGKTLAGPRVVGQARLPRVSPRRSRTTNEVHAAINLETIAEGESDAGSLDPSPALVPGGLEAIHPAIAAAARAGVVQGHGGVSTIAGHWGVHDLQEFVLLCLDKFQYLTLSGAGPGGKHGIYTPNRMQTYQIRVSLLQPPPLVVPPPGGLSTMATDSRVPPALGPLQPSMNLKVHVGQLVTRWGAQTAATILQLIGSLEPLLSAVSPPGPQPSAPQPPPPPMGSPPAPSGGLHLSVELATLRATLVLEEALQLRATNILMSPTHTPAPSAPTEVVVASLFNSRVSLGAYGSTATLPDGSVMDVQGSKLGVLVEHVAVVNPQGALEHQLVLDANSRPQGFSGLSTIDDCSLSMNAFFPSSSVAPPFLAIAVQNPRVILLRRFIQDVLFAVDAIGKDAVQAFHGASSPGPHEAAQQLPASAVVEGGPVQQAANGSPAAAQYPMLAPQQLVVVATLKDLQLVLPASAKRVRGQGPRRAASNEALVANAARVQAVVPDAGPSLLACYGEEVLMLLAEHDLDYGFERVEQQDDMTRCSMDIAERSLKEDEAAAPEAPDPSSHAAGAAGPGARDAEIQPAEETDGSFHDGNSHPDEATGYVHTGLPSPSPTPMPHRRRPHLRLPNALKLGMSQSHADNQGVFHVPIAGMSAVPSQPIKSTWSGNPSSHGALRVSIPSLQHQAQHQPQQQQPQVQRDDSQDAEDHRVMAFSAASPNPVPQDQQSYYSPSATAATDLPGSPLRRVPSIAVPHPSSPRSPNSYAPGSPMPIPDKHKLVGLSVYQVEVLAATTEPVTRQKVSRWRSPTGASHISHLVQVLQRNDIEGIVFVNPSTRATHVHIKFASETVQGVLCSTSFNHLIAACTGNLTDDRSKLAPPAPPQPPKPAKTEYSPQLAFGPILGEDPSLCLTFVWNKFQAHLEGHPGWWDPGRVGEPADAAVPFVGVELWNCSLAVQMMQPSGDLQLSLSSTDLQVYDLRLADPVMRAAADRGEATASPNSMSSPPKPMQAFTPRDFPHSLHIGVGTGWGSSQGSPGRDAVLGSADNEGAHYGAGIPRPVVEEMDLDYDDVPVVRIVQTHAHFPEGEVMHLEKPCEARGPANFLDEPEPDDYCFRVRFSQLADSTSMVQVQLRESLLQWPYLTDTSLVSAIISVLVPSWGSPANPTGHPAVLQPCPWLYFNMILAKSQVYIPLISPHLPIDDPDAIAGTLFPHLAELFLHKLYPPTARPPALYRVNSSINVSEPVKRPVAALQQLGLALTMGHLRFGYFAGGDGGSRIKVDLQKVAGHLRDPSATVSCFLLPLKVASFDLDSAQPTTADNSILMQRLRTRTRAAMLIQRMWRTWKAERQVATRVRRSDPGQRLHVSDNGTGADVGTTHELASGPGFVATGGAPPTAAGTTSVTTPAGAVPSQGSGSAAAAAAGGSSAGTGAGGLASAGGLRRAASKLDQLMGAMAIADDRGELRLMSMEERLLQRAWEHAAELDEEVSRSRQALPRVSQEWPLEQRAASGASGQSRGGPSMGGAVLQPLDLAMHESHMSLSMSDCTLRAAFSNVPFWQSVLQEVRLATNHLASNGGLFAPAPPALVDRARQLEIMHSPPIPRRTLPQGHFFRPSKFSVDVRLATLSAVLCDDKPNSFGAPDVLQAEASQVILTYIVEASLPGHDPQVTSKVALRLAANFLNSSTSRWEAMVQPWPLTLTLSDPINPMFKSNRTKYLWANSEQALQVRFHPSCLLTIGDALAFVRLLTQRNQEPSWLRPSTTATTTTISAPTPLLMEDQMALEHLITERVPQRYLIHNQTGLDLWYSVDARRAGRRFRLLNSCREELQAAPAPALVRTVTPGGSTVSRRQAAVIHLQAEGSWNPINGITVDEVGKFRYHLQTPLADVRMPIIVDVTLAGRTKILRLHSPLWLHNSTSMPLTLKLHLPHSLFTGHVALSPGDAWGSTFQSLLLKPLRPDEGRYLPVAAALDGVVTVVPDGYQAARADVIRLTADLKKLKDQQGYIACDPVQASIGRGRQPTRTSLTASRIHLAVQVKAKVRDGWHFAGANLLDSPAQNEFVRLQEPLESTVRFQPTLVLTNALPYFMRLTVSSSPIAPPELTKVADLPPGAAKDLYVDRSANLFMSASVPQLGLSSSRPALINRTSLATDWQRLELASTIRLERKKMGHPHPNDARTDDEDVSCNTTPRRGSMVQSVTSAVLGLGTHLPGRSPRKGAAAAPSADSPNDGDTPPTPTPARSPFLPKDLGSTSRGQHRRARSASNLATIHSDSYPPSHPSGRSVIPPSSRQGSQESSSAPPAAALSNSLPATVRPLTTYPHTTPPPAATPPTSSSPALPPSPSTPLPWPVPPSTSDPPSDPPSDTISIPVLQPPHWTPNPTYSSTQSTPHTIPSPASTASPITLPPLQPSHSSATPNTHASLEHFLLPHTSSQKSPLALPTLDSIPDPNPATESMGSNPNHGPCFPFPDINYDDSAIQHSRSHSPTSPHSSAPSPSTPFGPNGLQPLIPLSTLPPSSPTFADLDKNQQLPPTYSPAESPLETTFSPLPPTSAIFAAPPAPTASIGALFQDNSPLPTTQSVHAATPGSQLPPPTSSILPAPAAHPTAPSPHSAAGPVAEGTEQASVTTPLLPCPYPTSTQPPPSPPLPAGPGPVAEGDEKSNPMEPLLPPSYPTSSQSPQSAPLISPFVSASLSHLPQAANTPQPTLPRLAPPANPEIESTADSAPPRRAPAPKPANPTRYSQTLNIPSAYLDPHPHPRPPPALPGTTSSLPNIPPAFRIPPTSIITSVPDHPEPLDPKDAPPPFVPLSVFTNPPSSARPSRNPYQPAPPFVHLPLGSTKPSNPHPLLEEGEEHPHMHKAAEQLQDLQDLTTKELSRWRDWLRSKKRVSVKTQLPHNCPDVIHLSLYNSLLDMEHEHSSCKVVIYCQFWVHNRTGLPLVLHDDPVLLGPTSLASVLRPSSVIAPSLKTDAFDVGTRKTRGRSRAASDDGALRMRPTLINNPRALRLGLIPDRSAAVVGYSRTFNITTIGMKPNVEVLGAAVPNTHCRQGQQGDSRSHSRSPSPSPEPRRPRSCSTSPRTGKRSSLNGEGLQEGSAGMPAQEGRAGAAAQEGRAGMPARQSRQSASSPNLGSMDREAGDEVVTAVGRESMGGSERAAVPLAASASVEELVTGREVAAQATQEAGLQGGQSERSGAAAKAAGGHVSWRGDAGQGVGSGDAAAQGIADRDGIAAAADGSMGTVAAASGDAGGSFPAHDSNPLATAAAGAGIPSSMTVQLSAAGSSQPAGVTDAGILAASFRSSAGSSQASTGSLPAAMPSSAALAGNPLLGTTLGGVPSTAGLGLVSGVRSSRLAVASSTGGLASTGGSMAGIVRVPLGGTSSAAGAGVGGSAAGSFRVSVGSNSAGAAGSSSLGAPGSGFSLSGRGGDRQGPGPLGEAWEASGSGEETPKGSHRGTVAEALRPAVKVAHAVGEGAKLAQGLMRLREAIADSDRSGLQMAESHQMVQRLYQFAVDVHTAPTDGVFRRTRVVTVKNKYMVLNDTDIAIEIKQKGTPDPTVTAYGVGRRFARVLPPGARCALHWDNALAPLEVVMRPAGGAWHWSGSFPIPDKEDYFGLRLRHRRRVEYMIIPVNITVGASRSVLVAFKRNTSLPPYRIENRCQDVVVLITQAQGRPEHEGMGVGIEALPPGSGTLVDDDQEVDWDVVQPGEEIPYAWDRLPPPTQDKQGRAYTVWVKAYMQGSEPALGFRSLTDVFTLPMDELKDQYIIDVPFLRASSSAGGAPGGARGVSSREQLRQQLASAFAAECARKVHASVYADGPTRVLCFSDEKRTYAEDDETSVATLKARLQQVADKLKDVNTRLAERYAAAPQARAAMDPAGDAASSVKGGGAATAVASDVSLVPSRNAIPRIPSQPSLVSTGAPGTGFPHNLQLLPSKASSFYLGNVQSSFSSAGAFPEIEPEGYAPPASVEGALPRQQQSDLLADMDLGPVGGDLIVRVSEAWGLKSGIRGGSYAQFVTVRAMGMKGREVVVKSVPELGVYDPADGGKRVKWGFEARLRDVSALQELVILVFDAHVRSRTNVEGQLEPVIGKYHNFLGCVSIPLQPLPPAGFVTYPLARRLGAQEVSGDISVEVEWQVTKHGLLLTEVSALEKLAAERADLLARMSPVMPEESACWMLAVKPHGSTPQDDSAALGEPTRPLSLSGSRRNIDQSNAGQVAGGTADSGQLLQGMSNLMDSYSVNLEIHVLELRNLPYRSGWTLDMAAALSTQLNGMAATGADSRVDARHLPHGVVEVTLLDNIAAVAAPQRSIAPRLYKDNKMQFQDVPLAADAVIRVFDQVNTGFGQRNRKLLGELTMPIRAIPGTDPKYVWLKLTPPGHKKGGTGGRHALLDEPPDAPLMFARIQITKPAVRGVALSLKVHLAGVGFLAVRGVAEELLHFQVDKLVWGMRQGLSEMTVSAWVRALQLDNQLFQATEPVVLARTGGADLQRLQKIPHAQEGISWQADDISDFDDSENGPLVRLQVVRSYANSISATTGQAAGAAAGEVGGRRAEGSIVSFKTVDLEVKAIDVRLEELFLEAALLYASQLPLDDLWQTEEWKEQQDRQQGVAHAAAQKVVRASPTTSLAPVQRLPRGEAALAWLMQRDAAELEAMLAQSSTWFFLEQATLGDLLINVTVALSSRSLFSAARPQQDDGSDAVGSGTDFQHQALKGVFQRVVGGTGFQLINVSDVHLQLDRVDARNYLTNRTSLMAALTRHYTWQALKEARKVLGGAGPAIAQIPASLLWAGFSLVDLTRDLAARRVAATSVVPRFGFLMLMLGSQISGFVSRGALAVLSALPAQSQSRFSDAMALQRFVKRPSNALDAFSAAFWELMYGVSAGVVGLVLDPAAGAQGARGAWVPVMFTLGLLKGAVGLGVRPGVALVEAISKTLQGGALICLGKQGIQGSLQRRVMVPGTLGAQLASVSSSMDARTTLGPDEIAMWQRVLPGLIPQAMNDHVVDVFTTRGSRASGTQRTSRLMVLTSSHVAYLKALTHQDGTINYHLKWVVPREAVYNVRVVGVNHKIVIDYRQTLKALKGYSLPRKRSFRVAPEVQHSVILLLSHHTMPDKEQGPQHPAAARAIEPAPCTNLNIAKPRLLPSLLLGPRP